jgi:hypothetical protein
MGGNSMGLVGLETPSATRQGGPTSAANLLAEGDRPGPTGMNTPSIPAEELSGGGAVDAQAILNFCSSNDGKIVGTGECFDLVDKAFRKAGAKSAADFGEVKPDVEYVWGSAVSLADAKPGDAIQFSGYVASVERDNPRETDTKNHSRPHHSAIIKSVSGDGTVVVWEQNAPDEKDPVRANTLWLKDSVTKNGDETITVKVGGRFKIYRAQKR